MIALKADSGTGALDQMVVAEYFAAHFDGHIRNCARRSRQAGHVMEALNEQFGTAVEFDEPKGGIFLWVKLPDQVDTCGSIGRARGRRRDQSRAGMVDRRGARKCRMRLCFASPSHDDIRAGIAILAEICRKEFGVPARSGNIEQRG